MTGRGRRRAARPSPGESGSQLRQLGHDEPARRDVGRLAAGRFSAGGEAGAQACSPSCPWCACGAAAARRTSKATARAKTKRTVQSVIGAQRTVKRARQLPSSAARRRRRARAAPRFSVRVNPASRSTASVSAPERGRGEERRPRAVHPHRGRERRDGLPFPWVRDLAEQAPLAELRIVARLVALQHGRDTHVVLAPRARPGVPRAGEEERLQLLDRAAPALVELPSRQLRPAHGLAEAAEEVRLERAQRARGVRPGCGRCGSKPRRRRGAPRPRLSGVPRAQAVPSDMAIGRARHRSSRRPRSRPPPSLSGGGARPGSRPRPPRRRPPDRPAGTP